jgi:hypothetical protein
MQRINEHDGRSSTVEDLRAMIWRLLYRVRQAKGAPEAFQIPEAQELISRTSGFPNWAALLEAVAAGISAPGEPYAYNAKESRIEPRRNLMHDDWDQIIAAMKAHKIPTLYANGRMTDEALQRVAELDFVTNLNLEGSRALSDDGLQQLARMPQLQDINVSGTPVTDGGLKVLRQLPNLRHFKMTWHKNASDEGVSHLRFCEKLESVNVMGCRIGDGLIEALRGKPDLHHLSTGGLVTDTGLAMLRDFPRFERWHDGECRYDLMTQGNEPTYLLIDGPFTDAGLAAVARLDGVSGLNLFWNVENVSATGIGALVSMRNLRHFRCDGKLVDDAVMAHIARMPRLRMLVIQGTMATDDGFAALSHSPTLEYLWGRECPNLTGRGFAALANLRTLRGLGVSCKRVDDSSLAALPRFYALREFMPMDVPDAGFVHAGQCANLENLWCMYCRETTDAATEHIAGLHLKTYYAGSTQITDRSLEMLGRMSSLEVVEFFETRHITDGGLAHLAKLPRLQRIEISGLPNVTLAGTKVFPSSVQVNWDV